MVVMTTGAIIGRTINIEISKVCNTGLESLINQTSAKIAIPDEI